ncbi:UBP-type zinc finger domain-containing protein [Mucilaginibacter angelicae]|uniref:UBP-type zinc finger domain-containing protein n=1 Tax=Mucilaginibacter angelicae TaxID=869718 RepID=A0ABV6L0D3_9SPHI
MNGDVCEHLENFTIILPDKDVCEECVKTGSYWVHLRCCQTCGAVLCCDSSPNQHARQHARNTKHPVIISAEPDEKWAYCFIDDKAMGL